jgi:hypothetical protein
MAVTHTFPGTRLSHFKELFIPKKEYVSRVREMDLKERLFDWKPTTLLEKEVKAYIIDNALVKAGSKSLRITSYIISDTGSNITAYLSYGSKHPLSTTQEGRRGDIGYFLYASETPEGLSVLIKTKNEYYKNRTRLLNALWITLGLIIGIIPGIVFIIILIFMQPKMYQKKINKYVIPPLNEILTRQ